VPETLPYAVWLEREVVEVAGEESGPYLQGQLSQDVLSIGDGASAWSWVLTPQGKVDAFARVTRLSPERWVLDTDAGWGEALVARLSRFKLRTKATIELLDWKVLGLRVPADGAPGPQAGGSGNLVAADPCWPGVAGVDLMAEIPFPPEGWRIMGPDQHEAERIRVGFPRMGAELDERTIPGETGLVPRTVSFTKGCYTGQELVARIDSRGGNVARRLARLAPAAKVEPGSPLVAPGAREAGVLTSVAEAPDGRWVALGYLKRGVDTQGSLAAGPDAVTVTVEGLVG
jgi:folate-binding protein YgfZ